jgi:hypothetical protein
MSAILRRLAIVGSICALVTGSVLAAGPALASADTVYPCYDQAAASPTPLHVNYTEGSTSNNVPDGTNLYGWCNYVNNTNESRWYMQVQYDGVTYFVWVQRLKYGQSHHCDFNGNTGVVIGTNSCPLFPKTPGS